MATENPPRKRARREDHASSSDIGALNNSVVNPTLPSHIIIEKIIPFLPIKQAISCRVLSKDFKDSGRFNREVTIDIWFARHVGTVARVLTSCLGPNIDKFRLVHRPVMLEKAVVDDWIRTVTLKGVEELDLDFTWSNEHSRLCLDLLLVKSIRVLKVASCQLDPPLLKLNSSTGFSLKTLVLRSVGITSELIISTFLSNFLLLESLELLQCSGVSELNVVTETLKGFKKLAVEGCNHISRLNIDSPTLCSLRYYGYHRGIRFISRMPNLNDVTINYVRTSSLLQPESDMANIINTGLARVHDLRVNCAFLKELSPKYVDGTRRGLDFTMWTLKEFHLLIQRAKVINPCDIFSFLQNCPSVKRVSLDLGEFAFESGDCWETHSKPEFGQCDHHFVGLKTVEVKGFKFRNLELKMVKFFLSKARVLEKFTLMHSKTTLSENFFRDVDNHRSLIYSWKACPVAEIEYLPWKAST